MQPAVIQIFTGCCLTGKAYQINSPVKYSKAAG